MEFSHSHELQLHPLFQHNVGKLVFSTPMNYYYYTRLTASFPGQRG